MSEPLLKKDTEPQVMFYVLCYIYEYIRAVIYLSFSSPAVTKPFKK